MQYNQSFWGNGFTNGPYFTSNNPPLQPNAGMYPEIVGEGEVTSVTLPDGTVQFFFMPTLKWWGPNTFPYQPNMANSMYNNMNCHNPHWNNNLGTWFIRSVSNPSPQTTYNPPSQRHEVPRLYYNSDCNMHTCNNGYQLKFHNDNWTSTTDLQYFYPPLRQCNVIKQPCKGTAAVQVDTIPAANTVCHYEVLCSKPCNCNTNPKSMSLVSLDESKSNAKPVNGSTDNCSSGNIGKKSSKDFKKRKEEDKIKRIKSKNVICECGSLGKIKTAEKSVTTFTDMSSSCIPMNVRETQTVEISKRHSSTSGTTPQSCCKKTPIFKADNVLQRCEVKEAEIWQPITSFSKRAMIFSENVTDISDTEYNGCGSSTCSLCSG